MDTWASCSLKSWWTEISLVTVNGGELHGSSSMHSWNIIHWIIELRISKYLSLCVTGIFSKIQSHILPTKIFACEGHKLMLLTLL